MATLQIRLTEAAGKTASRSAVPRRRPRRSTPSMVSGRQNRVWVPAREIGSCGLYVRREMTRRRSTNAREPAMSGRYSYSSIE